MAGIVKTLAVFAISVVVGFGLFAVSFHLHLLRSVDIVFYRGLVLLSFAGMVTFIGLLAGRSVLGIPASTAFSAAVLSMSLNLSFLVVFPVTIDRSISVFLLNEMDHHPDTEFTSAQMKDIFIKRYMGEWDQIDRRMHEQLQSHNLVRRGDSYKISLQGRTFMRLSQLLASVFDTDPRFVGSVPEKLHDLSN